MVPIHIETSNSSVKIFGEERGAATNIAIAEPAIEKEIVKNVTNWNPPYNEFQIAMFRLERIKANELKMRMNPPLARSLFIVSAKSSILIIIKNKNLLKFICHFLLKIDFFLNMYYFDLL